MKNNLHRQPDDQFSRKMPRIQAKGKNSRHFFEKQSEAKINKYASN
ncbi:hypothetical protein [Agrobacterium sp. LAD9]|nr:hypothetical protein [Agrobacterium sp. LAD9]